MIIAAVAVSALGVRAAAIDWAFSQAIRTDKGTASDLTGYSAYIFTDTAWNSVTAAVSGGTLDPSSFSGYLGSAGLDVTTAATARTYATGTKTITGASLSEGTYYIVLANLDAGGDVWSKSITTTSAVYDESADPVPSHSVASWSLSKTQTGSYLNTGNSTGWTVSVPEPTSGLMLLLGIAGLALKRKRA